MDLHTYRSQFWGQTSYGILVDMKRRMPPLSCTSKVSSPLRTLLALQSVLRSPYLQLLSKFSSLTQVCSPDTPILHNITHHIETVGPPVSARPRRLAPERLQVARREFEHMLQINILIQCLVIPTSHGAQKSCW